MEHEFRLHRHPVWFCFAEQQFEPDFRDSWGQAGRYSRPMDCRPGIRVDYPADHRLHERQNVESSGSPQALFSVGSNSGVAGLVDHAQLPYGLGRRRHVVDAGRINQYHHATHAGVRRRYVAR